MMHKREKKNKSISQCKGIDSAKSQRWTYNQNNPHTYSYVPTTGKQKRKQQQK